MGPTADWTFHAVVHDATHLWHGLGIEAVSNYRHVVNASCLFVDTCVKFSNDRASRWTTANPIMVHWTWTAVLIHRKGLWLEERNAHTIIPILDLDLDGSFVKWSLIKNLKKLKKINTSAYVWFSIFNMNCWLTDWLTDLLFVNAPPALVWPQSSAHGFMLVFLSQTGLLHPRHHGNHDRGHCCINMQEQRHLWQVGICVVTHKKHVFIFCVSLVPPLSVPAMLSSVML